MNIFKSLSQGNGRISETNITSFLSFLLGSTNEFDSAFLLLFFELIDKNHGAGKIMEVFQLKQQSFRAMVSEFSKKYSVTAEPEYTVKKELNKQVIDVFLRVTNRKSETDIAYFLIENKINTFASNREQVSKQFDYFKQMGDVDHKLPVYSILITTDFETFSSMYTNISSLNDRSAWLRWTNRKNIDNSIEGILRKLLIFEQQAHIQPINPNSQFIIKSFIDYIVTEFSNTLSGERNFSFNGSDEIDNATVKLDGQTYILRRYENKMIRVFDEEDNVREIEVLPLLKKINEHFSLKVPIAHSSGTPKNTQVFGREIISGINSIQSMISIK